MFKISQAKSGALTLSLPTEEALVLRELPGRLREVLRRPDVSKRIVERLFPRAYQDAAKEAEYRKLLGKDLLSRKLESIRAFEETFQSWKVRPRRVEVTVEPARFDLWLGFVNDMRLLLGTELDVQEGYSDEPFDPAQPRGQDMALFHYLGGLEEELLLATGFLGPNPPAGS